MSMVSIKDWKKPDDTIDWRGYRAARVSNGEVCFKCNTYITCTCAPGHEQLCYECKDIAKPDELDHSSYVRCPSCGHAWNPGECDDYECFGDGEHRVQCGECDHCFEISTSVSYSFQSPAMLKEGKESNGESD